MNTNNITNNFANIFSFGFRRKNLSQLPKSNNNNKKEKVERPWAPFEFTLLPQEIQLSILKYLPCKDLLRFEKTSKGSCILANDRFLWIKIGYQIDIEGIDLLNKETNQIKIIICDRLRRTQEIVKRKIFRDINILLPLEEQIKVIQQKKLEMTEETKRALHNDFGFFVEKFLEKDLWFTEKIGTGVIHVNKITFTDLLQKLRTLLDAGAELQKMEMMCYSIILSCRFLEKCHIDALVEFNDMELTKFFCKICPSVNYNNFKPFDIKYLPIINEMSKNKSHSITLNDLCEIEKTPYYLELFTILFKNKCITRELEITQNVIQKAFDEQRKLEDILPFLAHLPKGSIYSKEAIYSFNPFQGQGIEKNNDQFNIAQVFLDHGIVIKPQAYSEALHSIEKMKTLLSLRIRLTIDFESLKKQYFYQEQHFLIAHMLKEIGINFPACFLQQAINRKDNIYLLKLLPLYEDSKDIFYLQLPCEEIEEYIELVNHLVSARISLALSASALNKILTPSQVKLGRFFIALGVQIDPTLFNRSIRSASSILAKNLTAIFEDIFFLDIRFPKIYFTSDAHFEIAQAYVNRGFRLPTSYLAQAIKTYDLSKLRKLVSLYLNQSPIKINIPSEFDHVKASALAVILKPLLLDGEEIVNRYLNLKPSEDELLATSKIENPKIQIAKKKKKINSYLIQEHYFEAMCEMRYLPNPERSIVLKDIIKFFFLRENLCEKQDNFMKILAEKIVEEEDLTIVLEILFSAQFDQENRQTLALAFEKYLFEKQASLSKIWYEKWIQVLSLQNEMPPLEPDSNNRKVN